MKQILTTISKKLITICTIAILAFSISSCDDEDEKIVVKDYGLKTFSADYNYSSGTYYDQVYFSFADSLIATATYDTDDWTQFYLIPDSAATNYTSDVEGWDLVFTNYTANLGTEAEPFAHSVTGVLINTETEIEVGFFEYTEYDDSDSIASAFVDISLSDIDTISFSTDADAIGYDWKTYTHSSGTYTVSTNYFYFVKLDDDTIYKLRFTIFYGESTSERIATIQYQLLQ